MIKLIETLEAALSNLVQEIPAEASVLVQFAAGDWARIKESIAAARAEWDATATPPASTAPDEAPAIPEPAADPVESDAPAEVPVEQEPAAVPDASPQPSEEQPAADVSAAQIEAPIDMGAGETDALPPDDIEQPDTAAQGEPS